MDVGIRVGENKEQEADLGASPKIFRVETYRFI